MHVNDLSRIVADFLGPDAPPRVGVAVSGGGDSVALLHAAVQAGFEVEAATVDHGLRADAALEAQWVGQLCARLGVRHSVLNWDGGSARGNLMDAARRARLELIGGWARARGIGLVLLGHTADDQAETFLMRVAREAGLDGLSGIRPRFDAEGVIWARPLMGVSRAALRGWLSARNIDWIDDPSNDNEKFGRVRARRAMAALAPVGVTPATVGAVIGHLASANTAFERMLADWSARHVVENGLEIRFPDDAFHDLDPELRRRLIVAALMWVSWSDYAPRAAKVAAFLAHPRDCTLHGCAIRRAGGQVVITREAQAVRGLHLEAPGVWDGWRVQGRGAVACLGAAIAECPQWRGTGYSRAALVASPALWRDGRLIAAPFAGYGEGWTPENLRGSFAQVGFRR